MKTTKKILAGILILVLISMSAIHVLADENHSLQPPSNQDYQEAEEGLDNPGEELDAPQDSPVDADDSYCAFGDELGCCNTQEGELELEDADINEIDVEELDLEDYEKMELFFIASPVLHTPDEQLIAVFFEEELALTEATLHTRSLITGEEFAHSYYMIIENTVSFVIDHPEGSGEDEILLVSIEYTFEGHEEPVVLEFSDHGIETSYTVTNEPMPGSEESGIVVHGIAEDGEIITETADIENLSEAIEEIIYAIDEDATDYSDAPIGIAPTSAAVMGIAPTSAVATGIAPTSGINPTSGNRIIVVSAGHCSTHAGASANGLVEHELNWHVAGVVVDELNRFPGITAIRDRPTIGCRWPGGGWQRCVTERVHQAGRDGATVFVDIHFNASTSSAAHGAEIWIPNTSRDDGMHQVGRQMSDEILRRLSALGMHNRGHRMHANWDTEFASVRIARELGMLGILVEGGFLTNTGDANRLRDPNFRHQMGLEIARGIAAIDISNIGRPPEPIVSTTTARDANGQETLFDLRTVFSSGGAQVSRVRFAVWGEVNGQNDLIWYEGTRNADGSWGARADVRRHGETGRYQVHAWVTTTIGQQAFTSGTTFNVRAATGGVAQVLNNNPNAGTFDVAVSGINSVSGISEVRIAVWSQDGQRDLVWYTGVRQTNGSFRVTVNLANHNFNLGNYHIHAWVTTGNGQRFAVTTRHNVTTRPQATVTATNRNGTEILYDLRATNVAIIGNMQQVQFAVWSEHNGQNDLIWYDGSRQADGSWTATADVRRHRYTGRYHVHVWGNRADGSRVFVGATSFNVTRPSGSNPQVVNNNPSAGTFDVVVAGLRSVSGITEVRVAAWSQEGQRDLVWYTGVRQANGSFRVTVNLANHNFNLGTYHIHAWVTTGNGQNFAVTTTHRVTTRPQATVTATNRNGTEIFYDLRATNVAIFGDMQQVRFAVWSDHNGQNDLIWYDGSRQANGSWTASADIRRHRYTGRYHVHVWGTRADGSGVFIGATTFNVTPSSGPNPQVVNSNPSVGTFDVVVSGIRSVSGISEVRVAVWSQEGQRDLVWYTGVRQTDGSHRVTVNLANHNFNLGNYHIHAWLTTGNGKNFAVTTRHNVTSRPQATVTATRRAGSENLFDLRMTNVALFGNMQRVQFAVWSDRSGQGDLIWYEGARQANGSWTATADSRRHRYTGRYQVHVWGNRADGSRVFMGGTTFNVPVPTVGLTPIMGNSQTYVAQMVRNYRNTGHTFPEAALGMNLNQFAQLVLNEANREGVRGEVLWAQIMRETGWLQFGGCVSIDQFNFGGLGATGGGNPGHSFPSVQIGLRAQVHHLVAYATTTSVRNPSNRAHPVMRTSPPWGPTGQTVVNGTESPRFHFVARGISPYVNWLGQGENPNHPGFWAADRNYGAALAAAIVVLLNS